MLEVPEMAGGRAGGEGFSPTGKAVLSVLGVLGGVVSGTVGVLAALGLLRFGGHEAKAAPAQSSPTPAYATAAQVDALAAQVGEYRNEVKGYLVRTNVLEIWKAEQDGVEKQRTRDALLRQRGR